MQPSQPIPAGTIVQRDLAYVTNGHERQQLDLYLPVAEGRLPLIVWIHGGAFRWGSKADQVPIEYVAKGYAIASINYRLSGHALFPAQIEDCKAAVRWLRANADRYQIDPQRIISWGPSAGGHLATMLGTAGGVQAFEVGENLAYSSQVKAVIDYFGPTDFLQMDAHRLPDGMVHDAPDSPESLLVGGAIQEHPERVAQVNPISYIDQSVPPFLVIHGDTDPLVPHNQSELLVAALRAAGGDVTFYTVVGGGHGGFTDPQVDVLTEAFLAKHM